jgi:hypothetical protein
MRVGDYVCRVGLEEFKNVPIPAAAAYFLLDRCPRNYGEAHIIQKHLVERSFAHCCNFIPSGGITLRLGEFTLNGTGANSSD